MERTYDVLTVTHKWVHQIPTVPRVIARYTARPGVGERLLLGLVDLQCLLEVICWLLDPWVAMTSLQRRQGNQANIWGAGVSLLGACLYRPVPTVPLAPLDRHH